MFGDIDRLTSKRVVQICQQLSFLLTLSKTCLALIAFKTSANTFLVTTNAPNVFHQTSRTAVQQQSIRLQFFFVKHKLVKQFQLLNGERPPSGLCISIKRHLKWYSVERVSPSRRPYISQILTLNNYRLTYMFPFKMRRCPPPIPNFTLLITLILNNVDR